MLEHLAAAMVARTERGADSEAMDVVARRALEERDPALRVATLRALRRTSAIENTGDLYEKLVRDASHLSDVPDEDARHTVDDGLRETPCSVVSDGRYPVGGGLYDIEPPPLLGTGGQG